MDESTSPIEQAARQRLESPGVFQRAPVQERLARLQQPALAQGVAERLFRRAVAVGPQSAAALTWRRAPDETLAETLPQTDPAPRHEAVAPGVRIAARGLRVPALASAAGVQSTVVGRAAAPVLARKASSTPTAPGHEPAAGRAASRFTQGAHAREPAVDSHAAPPVPSPAAAPALSVAPTAPSVTLMRKPEAAARPTLRLPAAAHAHERGGMPVSSPTRTVSGAVSPAASPQTTSLPAAMPLVVHPHEAAALQASAPVAREMAEPRPTALAAAPARVVARPVARAGQAAAEMTLQRSPDPSAPSLLPRQASAAAQAFAMLPSPALAPAEIAMAAPPAMPAPALQPEPATDIGWITEEVGRRLMQRLAIERERKGIRSWR